jgi:cytochrome c biogenesis protein CcmG, thiol:disulfide interchange protein DsbE
MHAVFQTFLLVISLTSTILLTAQDMVPRSVVKTIEGQNIDFREATSGDKITIVSFWATWCAPCKKELDAITDLYEEWQEKYNVQLVAVSVDDARAAAKVKPMVAEKGWPFRILIDTNQELMRSLHFQSVPYTIIIDRQGQIVYNHSGYLPGDELELEEKIASLSQ